MNSQQGSCHNRRIQYYLVMGATAIGGFLVGAGLISAQENAIRPYQIPGHGVLELRVPTSWRDEVETIPGGIPTITFHPQTGAQFEVLVSVLWSKTGQAGFNSTAQVRAQVERNGLSLLSTAVEPQLVLEELRGPSGAGYYYSFTDNAPKPGEYKYLTQGGMGVGDLLLSFTILTHAKDSKPVQYALTMLREARQQMKSEGTTNTKPTREIALPGNDWALAIDLPGFVVSREQLRDDNQGAMMQAENGKTGMVVSIFLERAPTLGTSKACRDFYWAKDLKSPLKKTDIQLSESAQMALVEWMVHEFGGAQVRQKNVKAFMARKDVCIDIHLSKAGFTPGDQTLFTKILDSVRYNDELVSHAAADAGNLLKNPQANDGIQHWVARGNAAVEETVDGNPAFVIRNKGSLFQDVKIPPDAAGQHAVLIGLVSSERINSDGAITGLPSLYGYMMAAEGERIHAYLQGQHMLHSGKTVNELVAAWGIFHLPAETSKIRFFLNQAERQGVPQNGSAALFDDLGLYLVPTREAADALVDLYRQRNTRAVVKLQQTPAAASTTVASANELKAAGPIARAGQADTQMVTSMLAQGIDPNIRDEEGYTAIMRAARNGHTAIVQALLTAGADVKAQTLGTRIGGYLGGEGETPLMMAARWGHADIVQILLSAGADVHTKSGSGFTALQHASVFGNTGIVKILSDKGADVNVKDSGSGTALMTASLHGHVATVKLLLARGADVHAKDKEGETALLAAARSGAGPTLRHAQTSEVLLAAGANINAKNNEGETALMAVAKNGYVPTAKVLLAHGADVNGRDVFLFGRSSLMAAAYFGHAGMVEFLIANGADVNAKTADGWTALKFAKDQNRTAIVELLKKVSEKE